MTVTDGVLERATDALWDEFCPAIRQTPEDMSHYRSGVLAVLRSIREPSEDMKNAGGLAINDDPDVLVVTVHEAGLAFAAMIDTIIKESSDG